MSLKGAVADTVARSLRFVLQGASPALYEHVYRHFERDIAGRAQGVSAAEFAIRLHCPEYREPDPADTALVARILAALGKMKRDQAAAAPVFQPSSMWQAFVDRAYHPLLDGAQRGDTDAARFFLENFGAWKENTGIESTTFVRQHDTEPALRTRFANQVLAPGLRWWLRAESRGRGLDALSYPEHGNQTGAIVNGNFLGPGSVLNDFYANLLRGYLRRDRPVVAELGGGYGKLFWFLARGLQDFVYVDFDLPEVLCCAAYYLMKAFPDKRALLYGEAAFDERALQDFDLIFLPAFEIERLAPRSVDLFINKNALGEVPRPALDTFVANICRTADVFFHMNHEFLRNSFDDGSTSAVNLEYPVDEDAFERLVRYPEIGQPMGSGRFDPAHDIFWYVYRRRDRCERRG